ncbi:hypothetical protein [Gordonia sp. (in: high G+C Gram-positive bacteria)]|uniref:hypothetical protein n=1 Tax=Gordonia sp. (in: high G+C Gram-positive bacteria) TaxID=84139 RepID=UPI003F977DB0
MTINLFAATLLVIVLIVVLALLYGFAYALVTTAKEKAQELMLKAKDSGKKEEPISEVEKVEQTPEVQEDVFAALEAQMSQEAKFNAELHGKLSEKELLSGTGFTEQEEIDAVQEELQKIIERGGDVR